MTTATLHYVEHVDNNAGNWTREWFGTLEEAEKRERELRRSYGRRKAAELIGEYGDVSPAESVTIDLTPGGVLAFARDWALNTGEG